MRHDPYMQQVLSTNCNQSIYTKATIEDMVTSGARLFSCIIKAPYNTEMNLHFDLCVDINIFILQCVVRGGISLGKLYYAKILTLATVPDIEHLIGGQIWNMVCNDSIWDEEFGREPSFNHNYRIPGLLTAAINHAIDQELSKAILVLSAFRYFFVDNYTLFNQFFLLGLAGKYREFMGQNLILPFRLLIYQLFNQSILIP